jgi:hypothetical protein
MNPMEATTVQDWAIEHYSPTADGGQVLHRTDVYRTDAQAIEGILRIERRCWGDRIRLRPAEPQDFDGKMNPFGHIKILPPDCKNWVLAGMVDGEIISRRTHRDTTLEDCIKLASEGADGYESVDLRPAFADDLAKDLSSEDWLKVRSNYDKWVPIATGYKPPGITSLIVIFGFALFAYLVPEWRLYTGMALGLAAVRLVVKFFAAGAHRAGYEYGFQSGVSDGVDRLAAKIDKTEPKDWCENWRWREIIASVGKPGPSK